MWADIMVPYWALLLAALLLAFLAGMVGRLINKGEDLQDEINLLRFKLRNPAKHYLWVGKHGPGQDFLRINSDVLSPRNFHHVGGSPHKALGYSRDDVMIFFGYGWQECYEAVDVIESRYPDAPRWYIP